MSVAGEGSTEPLNNLCFTQMQRIAPGMPKKP